MGLNIFWLNIFSFNQFWFSTPPALLSGGGLWVQVQLEAKNVSQTICVHFENNFYPDQFNSSCVMILQKECWSKVFQCAYCSVLQKNSTSIQSTLWDDNVEGVLLQICMWLSISQTFLLKSINCNQCCLKTARKASKVAVPLSPVAYLFLC